MAHPWFTSALHFHQHLDEALAAAQASGRRLLVVVGACDGTRALVERTLAKEELEQFTREKFVLLAAAEGALEPRLGELVAGLAVRAPTPLVLYLTTDGRLLASTAGGRPPAVLLNDMLGAVAKR